MERATLSDILREVKHAPELHDRLARIVYNLGGGRVPFVVSQTVGTSPVTNEEEAVCITPPLNPPSDSPFIILLGTYRITVGTSGTLLNTRFRQGSGIAGTAVSNIWVSTVVAATVVSPFVLGTDTPASAAGIQYSMTCLVTGGAAASAVAAALMIALALG
jgi:hypothetical protein